MGILYSSAIINNSPNLLRNYILNVSETLEEVSNIPSNVTIPYFEQLFSSLVITEKNTLDFNFNVEVGDSRNYKNSKVSVPYREDLYSGAIVRPAHTDFTSKGYNPYLEYFSSLARINESIFMDFDLDIIQPPVQNIEMIPIKDVYTREMKPTVNYGTSHSLVTGVGADGRYTTYIEFDLSNLIDLGNINFIDANFFLDKVDSETSTLEFYEVTSNWTEQYIVYANQVQYNDTPFLVETVAGAGTKKFSLRNIVKDYFLRGIRRFSFMIKSDDYSMFKSKESNTPPILSIDWSDPNWEGFIENLHMTNQAIIRAFKNQNVYSCYKMMSYLKQYGSALIRNADSRTDKAWLSSPSISGRAIPSLSDYIFSQAVIRRTGSSDIKGSGDHNELLANSVVNIPHREDMYSSVVILPDSVDNDTFTGSLEIIRTYVRSFVDIAKSSYLFNSATIRKADSEDVTSQAYITKNYIESKSDIAYGDLMYAGAVIRKDYSSDTTSSLYIDKPYVWSKYAIRKREDIYSSAIIIAPENDDTFTGSYSYLSRPMILSKYHLNKFNDIFSSAVIRKDIYEDIGSSLTIPEPVILVGGAIIRKVFSNGIYSKGHIRQFINDDTFLNEVYIHPKDDFISGATIRQLSEDSIISEGIIRQYVEENLASLADIFHNEQIYNIVDINQITQMISEAILRQKDVSNIASSAFVRGGWIHENNYAKAIIKDTATFLMCCTEIRTPARQWRSNIEGQLDFENRRLPRKWTRNIPDN